MTILNVTIEPSSSNWWKQRQRPTVEHWTELPKSSWEWKEWEYEQRRQDHDGNIDWNSLLEPMGAHKRQQDKEGTSIGTNYSPWMWVTVVWLGQIAEQLAMATGFVSPPWTGIWGTYSLWKDNLLSLDIVGRVLDLPQSNVSYPLWIWGAGWEVGGVEGRRRGSGNSDWYVKWKKKHTLFNILNTKLN